MMIVIMSGIVLQCHKEGHKDWHKCPKCDDDCHHEWDCPQCHKEGHKDWHKCPKCNRDFHHDCC